MHNESSPLKGNVTIEQIKHRVFRVSNISPMAANLNFVLYRRHESIHSPFHQKPSDHYYVQLRVNEKPHRLPKSICPENNVSMNDSDDTVEACQLTSLAKHFSHLIGESCDLRRICEVKGTNLT